MPGIDQGVFRRTVKEKFRITHQILVHGICACHQDGYRGFIAAASPPYLLPGAGDGAWVALHDDAFQRPDIDTQFQGIGGDHGLDRTIAQTPFNFPTQGRQIAAAIAPDFLLGLGAIRMPRLQICEHQLHFPARAGKDNALHVLSAGTSRPTSAPRRRCHANQFLRSE